jgi:4'-phosphopantetheinyl transferase EntD
MAKKFEFISPNLELPEGVFGAFLKVDRDAILHDAIANEKDIPPNLKTAVRKRQNEFFLGRIAANDALKKAGCLLELERGHKPGAAPIWPDGFTGSITHTAGLIGAVAAKSKDFSALGLDAEALMSEKTATRVINQILNFSEQSDLVKIASELNRSVEEIITLFFTAKEAIYKANSRNHPERNRFHDVEVALNKNGFNYRWTKEREYVGSGLFTITKDHAITLVTIQD